jgi:hypothetical protein
LRTAIWSIELTLTWKKGLIMQRSDFYADYDLKLAVFWGLMNVAAIVSRSIAVILAMLQLACHHTPPAKPYLPSRAPGEMFPRASSPPPTCPGQYASVIADANGDIFLGCWGHKAD